MAKIPKVEEKVDKIERARKTQSLQHREIEALKFQD